MKRIKRSSHSRWDGSGSVNEMPFPSTIRLQGSFWECSTRRHMCYIRECSMSKHHSVHYQSNSHKDKNRTLLTQRSDQRLNTVVHQPIHSFFLHSSSEEKHFFCIKDSLTLPFLPIRRTSSIHIRITDPYIPRDFLIIDYYI
jgi:hypothetical protein